MNTPRLFRSLTVLALFFAHVGRLWAAAPQWWATRGALTAGAIPNDYAAANLGQVKHIAALARDEMQATLPGGAGSAIDALVDSWAQPPAQGVTRNDYAAVNIGQLKALAKLFYERLAQFNYQGPPLSSGQVYPWTATTADDYDYAAVNIGQVKFLFSFDLALVVSAPVAITAQPPARTNILAGGAVTLTVATSGTPAPTFQWQKNGTNIAGATSSSYTIASAGWADAGSYTVVLTNSAGSTTSSAALVAVNDPVHDTDVRTHAFALFQNDQNTDALAYLDSQITAPTPVEKDLTVAQQLTRIAFAFHNRKDRIHAETVADLARTRLAPHLADTTLCALHFSVASEQAIAADLILGDASGGLQRIDCALRYLDQLGSNSSTAPIRAELQMRQSRLQQKLKIQQQP